MCCGVAAGERISAWRVADGAAVLRHAYIYEGNIAGVKGPGAAQKLHSYVTPAQLADRLEGSSCELVCARHLRFFMCHLRHAMRL